MNITPGWTKIFIFCIILICGCQSYRLNEEDLTQMFGSWRPTEYSLFQPNIRSRTKRSVGAEETTTEILEFQALGQNFKFRLKPVQDLLSEDFVLLSKNDWAEAEILDSTEVRDSCAFQGQDERNELNKIAIVTCGHLRGVVKSSADEFIIEPLPESVTRRHRHRRIKRTTFGSLTDHIIYKRRQYDGCSVDKESTSRQNNPENFEREYLHSRYSPFSTNHRGSSSLHSRPSSFSTNHHHSSSDEDRFRSSFPSASEENHRTSHETFYIETAVFVDKDLLKHMQTNFPSNTKQEVIQVVLAMVNAVQLLYSDPSLGHDIKYVLKRLELLYEDPRGLTRPHDIDEFLTKFCSWQHLENPSTDADPLHWDHALILTGLDLYTTLKKGSVNSQVVGLAPVAGMCTRTSSCTVNEGRHFESVYVVAHEIGHNLGMRHDGIQSGNNCDPSGYLMSPTLGSGKVTWSHCSKRYLTKFLDSTQAKCLKDKPQPPLKHLVHESRQLPGERFSADQQCLLKYGVGSESSTHQKQDEICRDLHCIRDHYTWTSHPALEGTQCGNYMWCRRGVCVMRPRAQEHSGDVRRPTVFESPSDKYQDASSSILGGEWDRWSDCRSPCLYGMDGILSSGSTGLMSSKRQCHSCKDEHRYLSCSAVRECSIRQKRTLQEFADEMCQRISREDSSLSGFADRLPLSGIRSCQIDCLTKGITSVPSRTFFPDGTVCRTLSTNLPTFCIAGYCTEFRCESNTLYGASSNVCRSGNRPLPSDNISGPQRIPFGIPVEAMGSSPPIISQPTWSPWVLSSSCQFSCLTPSKGIQLVSRTCLDPIGCQGLNRNIQLCSPDQTDCTTVESPFTFASKICQRYSKTVKQLSGIGMQLTSISEDPNRGCTVACQDSSLKYRFYKVNGKDGWFPFGTKCSSPEDKYEAFCLNGKCVEFNAKGAPLRNNDSKSGRDKGRSLEFFAYDTLLPALAAVPTINRHQNVWRTKRNLRSYQPPSGYRRTKREVKTTAHRLPGSFQDSFLLSLIDEINATFTDNGTRREITESPIDFENPLFHNDGQVESRISGLNRTLEIHKSVPLNKKATNANGKIFLWKIKMGPCSVTCGEGLQREVWNCADGSGVLVNASNCDQSVRPVDSHRLCSTARRCSKSSNFDDITFESPFSRWLIDLVLDIQKKH